MSDTYHNSDGTLRDFPWVKSEELGSIREHLFSFNHKSFKNEPQNRETEMFVTFEMKGKQIHGWLTRNETTEKFTNQIFEDCRFNQNIHFIEWDTRINCVVGDGIYISSSHFWMTKEECEKLIQRMIPAIK